MRHTKGIAASSLVEKIEGSPFTSTFYCGCGSESQVRVSSAMMAKIMTEMGSSIKGQLEGMQLPIRNILDDLNEFMGYYMDNPAVAGKGSTHFGHLLWIHIIAKSLNPSLIVESGAHIGRSLWTLQKACRDAKLVSFDISFENLKFNSPLIQYEEIDWSDSPIAAQSSSDLVFFDDNINNCLRVRQAYEKGFRHILLNTTPSLMNLHLYRWPGVPTIQMLDYMQTGDTIEWYCPKRCVTLKYAYDDAHTYGARELIDTAVYLPSLERFTGLNCPQNLTYVRLVENKAIT